MIDFVMPVTTLPLRGGDLLAEQLHVTTGGGFNAMSAAARVGTLVTYVGRLGTGPFSEVARGDLFREGIDFPIEPDAEHDMGTCIVLLEPDGERTFITAKGAEDTLTAAHLASCIPLPGDAVLVSGYNVMYPERAEALIDWIESFEDEVIVALDPANRVLDIPERYLGPTLARTDWLLVNTAEAESLAAGDNDFVRASELTHLVRRGVVLRRGERGCVVALRDGSIEEVPGRVTTVVDLNGAGDVHNGVFLAGLLSGENPNAAAGRANAAASFSIARLGPAHSPTIEELADIWP